MEINSNVIIDIEFEENCNENCNDNSFIIKEN